MIAPYEEPKALTFYNNGGNKLKLGARLGGDLTCSYLELTFDASAALSPKASAAAAEAQAYVLQVLDKDKKAIARFLGGQLGSNAGYHLESLDKDAIMLGAEGIARATLSEANVGPLYLHFGVGVSAAAKLEDSTLEFKLVGTGFKIGKKMGFSVLDNEFSIDIGDLFGFPFQGESAEQGRITMESHEK